MTAAKVDADACRKYAALATDAAQVPYVPGRPGMLAIDLAAVAEQLTAAADWVAENGDRADLIAKLNNARDEASQLRDERDALRAQLADLTERHERAAAAINSLQRQLAEQPALTAKEVQAVVREAAMDEWPTWINWPMGQSGSPREIADAIAARVAEKLAGRALTTDDARELQERRSLDPVRKAEIEELVARRQSDLSAQQLADLHYLIGWCHAGETDARVNHALGVLDALLAAKETTNV